MSEEEQFVWFVRDGRMYSGKVLSILDFSLRQLGEQKDQVAIQDHFKHIFGVQSSALTYNMANIVKRPGRWYFVSGHRIVHEFDAFGSREDAAEDYKNRLMDEDDSGG